MLPDLRGVAVMSMNGRVRKAVQKELGHFPGLAVQMMSNPGPQSYNQRAESLERELRSLTLRLNLIR